MKYSKSLLISIKLLSKELFTVSWCKCNYKHIVSLTLVTWFFRLLHFCIRARILYVCYFTILKSVDVFLAFLSFSFIDFKYLFCRSSFCHSSVVLIFLVAEAKIKYQKKINDELAIVATVVKQSWVLRPLMMDLWFGLPFLKGCGSVGGALVPFSLTVIDWISMLPVFCTSSK